MGLASDGQTRIAFDAHEGIHHDDSVAFVPGFEGDPFAEAVIHKEPGCDANAAGANHEIALLLGCSSATGTRIWNGFLINAGRGVDIIYLEGGPSGFHSLGLTESDSFYPVDGDTVRAERVGNMLSLFINGMLWARTDLTATPQMVARGSGIGLAAFIRPGAVHNKVRLPAGDHCATQVAHIRTPEWAPRHAGFSPCPRAAGTSLAVLATASLHREDPHEDGLVAWTHARRAAGERGLAGRV